MNAIDKSKWERGLWTDEPDLLNFQTEEGFDAAVIRQRSGGALCGYVGVPESHPWFGKTYSSHIALTPAQKQQPVDVSRISIMSLFAAALSGDQPNDSARIDCVIQVHGGLTYSDKGSPEFGENPALWYFGFDCSHSGDHSPGYELYGTSYGAYRDIDYVKSEINLLSAQLAAVKAPRFAQTYCSQCGNEQGAGDEGVSSCADHRTADLRMAAEENGA